ncbi:MAG: hypothetical protein H0X55_02925 [Thermoleophilaceae bacterium]|nr:hypothetical protein [Thermoleophilaceae bacterium]
MLVAVRMAWQFVITFPIREMTRDEEARTSTRERLMLGWSGMRGGISLAAAPLQEGVDGDAQESAEAFRRLRSKLISAERETMQEMRERGDLDGEVLRRIEHDLDLEESRLED